MSTLVQKATQKLQHKIRNISNEALPDLLAVGTGDRAGAGRLDNVIDGLDGRLCKAFAKNYPKIVAAAVIEKHRSQKPNIAAAAKAMANRDMPTDLERTIVLDKAEPMTDAKSAAKARRRAIKAQRKKEQAEASAAEARERLNKGADMDSMIVIAKSVIAGKPSAFTKRDFFLELQKRADQIRQPSETREKAFARYAIRDPNGQLLMQAHKVAYGDDYQGEPDEEENQPVTNDGYRRLMDLANEKRKDGETIEQAFARLYTDPKFRDLVASEKRLHNVQVAKATRAA
jgi:hypothetical protein